MRKLKMKLFGSFTLGDGTVTITELTMHSRKLMQLLIYILLKKTEVHTQQNLIETFWGDRSGNPEGALKNMMHRLRAALKVLGDDEFICTLPGAYQWNPEIEVETDYEEFERKAVLLRENEGNPQQSEAICRSIIEIYRGNISQRVVDEPWILPRVIWYRTVYIDAAKTLCGIFGERRRWIELEELSTRALGVDSLNEDLYCYQLRALFGQRKFDQMIERYEKICKLFYENVGVRRQEKVEQLFQELMAERNDEVTDLDSFMEMTVEPGKLVGAFFCDFQVFRQIYRIESRRAERMGRAEYIMMMTVHRRGRNWREQGIDNELVSGAQVLGRLIRQHLRGGDVAAQYSPTQYIMLLPACTYDSGIMVARRLQRQFRKNIGQRQLEITYELAEVPPVKQADDENGSAENSVEVDAESRAEAASASETAHGMKSSASV